MVQISNRVAKAATDVPVPMAIALLVVMWLLPAVGLTPPTELLQNVAVALIFHITNFLQALVVAWWKRKYPPSDPARIEL